MTTQTSNLRLILPVDGEFSGTWGDQVNAGLTNLVDTAISGYTTVSVTSAAQALTANNYAADQARAAMLNLTTTTTAAFAVYAPPSSKTYIVKNSSAYLATLYCSTVLGNTTAAGTGVNIPAGIALSVWTDGTNFYALNNTVDSINNGYLYGNRVINGAQEIDQVNNGAAQTPAAGTAYLTDMFGASISQSSKLTFQQVTDAPAGLLKSLKITVAAQFAPAATDYFQLFTLIEGKDVIDFQLGTSGAATITLSNWIKGSVAGTYTVALVNSGLNRSYVGTVSVTTSWTQVKITLQGDVTGTWFTDNTIGLRLFWDLGSGSNYNGTAGAWQAGNLTRTSGSVTFVNQVAGSTLNITGVDCRLGSVAPTVFERRANELQLAQRYYRISQFATGVWASANTAVLSILHLGMRAAPTAGINATATVSTGTTSFTQSAANIAVFSNTSDAGAYQLANFTGATGGTPALMTAATINLAARLF